MFRNIRAIAISAALALFCAGGFVVAQVVSLPHNVTVLGHLNSGQNTVGTATGAAPVGTGCTITAGSTDTVGACVATAASGSIAFNTAYLASPLCTLVDTAATPIAVYSVTTAQITLTTITSGHAYVWTCFGKVGG